MFVSIEYDVEENLHHLSNVHNYGKHNIVQKYLSLNPSFTIFGGTLYRFSSSKSNAGTLPVAFVCINAGSVNVKVIDVFSCGFCLSCARDPFEYLTASRMET